MKGGRRERLSRAGTSAGTSALSFPRLHVVYRGLPLGSGYGGGCQESVKSLINVSTEHHWQATGLQLSHLSQAGLPSAFQVWESSCGINQSQPEKAHVFFHGEKAAALQVVVSVEGEQVLLSSPTQGIK